MKILFVGDSHGNLPYMRQAIDLAHQYDAILIQLGDFGFWPNDHGFVEAVDADAARLDVPLFVIRGNHDWPQGFRDWMSREHGWLYAVPDGHVITFDDVRFGFMGGAVSVDQEYRKEGVSWWHDEVPSARGIEAAIADGPVDIWVTHDSVEIVPGRALFPCSPRVQTLVDQQRAVMRMVFHRLQPKLHVHGHWHHRYRAATQYGEVIGLDAESSFGVLLIDTETVLAQIGR